MTQQTLWHDTPEDALRALIDALGGPKKVGLELYPDRSMVESQRLLMKWCDPDRVEKPTLSQLLFLLKRGRQTGCHVLIGLLSEQSGYAATPIEPVDEMVELQKQFIKSVENQQKLLERIQRVQVRVA